MLVSPCFHASFCSGHINKFLSPPAGWSAESLQEWASYMKLAIPSTLMTCFEWWVFEFGGFFAGNPNIFLITLFMSIRIGSMTVLTELYFLSLMIRNAG